jgi:hypothetical protein
VLSRRYDDTFWKEILPPKTKRNTADILDELGF